LVLGDGRGGATGAIDPLVRAVAEVRSRSGLAQFSEEEEEEIRSLKKMNKRREKKNCALRAVAARTNKGCPDKGAAGRIRC
jgi:hypothetical protein